MENLHAPTIRKLGEVSQSLQAPHTIFVVGPEGSGKTELCYAYVRGKAACVPGSLYRSEHFRFGHNIPNSKRVEGYRFDVSIHSDRDADGLPRGDVIGVPVQTIDVGAGITVADIDNHIKRKDPKSVGLIVCSGQESLKDLSEYEQSGKLDRFIERIGKDRLRHVAFCLTKADKIVELYAGLSYSDPNPDERAIRTVEESSEYQRFRDHISQVAAKRFGLEDKHTVLWTSARNCWHFEEPFQSLAYAQTAGSDGKSILGLAAATLAESLGCGVESKQTDDIIAGLIEGRDIDERTKNSLGRHKLAGVLGVFKSLPREKRIELNAWRRHLEELISIIPQKNYA